MGYLLHVLAALLVLGAAESGLASAPARPLGGLLLLAAPHALSLAARSLGGRGRFRSAQALALVLEHAAPLCYALLVLALGWLRTVEHTFHLAPGVLGWPGPGLFVSLAPYALLELVAIDARARLDARSSDARLHIVGFERRMFASTFLPFVLYVGLAVLLGAHERLRVPLEEIGLYDTLFTLAALAGFVTLLPAVLRRTWSTVPLPAGSLRTMLEELARRAGFRYRELCLWSTGERMANAAIVGATARQRTVLFSDALLAQLTPREVAAVFAHEMGHALRWHVPFFVVTLALVFFALKLALRALPLDRPALELCLLALLVGLWALGFGYLSRRFELEADLESLALIGDPEPLVSALTQVGSAHAHQRTSWRHFANDVRIDFLERAARDPAVGAHLRAKLRRARGVCLAACLLALAGETVFLLRDLPEERVVVALRLGEFEQARGLPGAQAGGELARLVQRAAALGEHASAAAIEERAISALTAGDARAARELVALALLRGGDTTMETVHGLLERLEGGQILDPGTLQGHAQLSTPWREAFAARAMNGSS